MNEQPNPNPKQIAILIFDDVEVLDFAGPYEVFNVAGEVITPRPFEVFTVGLTGDPIRTRGAMQVTPHYGLDNCPPPDIALIPGGFGTRRLIGHARLAAWLVEQHARVEHLLSVCTGSLLLASAGLLQNQPATTHHSAFDRLAKESPTTHIVHDKRYVNTGKIVTSGGISAGIDMAFHIVETLLGSEALAKVQAEMEWGWHAGPPQHQERLPYA